MGRALLEKELIRRIDKNPRYSLRAFAKALGVSHTALSLVMTGKRPASRRLLERFADMVGLAPDEREQIISGTKSNYRPVPELSELDMDIFHLIADWHYYAVLSLLELPAAKFDSSWISQRLSISKVEAKLIMERLVRLGMIGEKDGRMQQITPPFAFNNKYTTAASRRFHKGLLNKAVDALENQSMTEHDFSSTTFAMDIKHVPYAREKVRAFRRKLVQDLENKGPPTHVVNLTVQIFPVSH